MQHTTNRSIATGILMLAAFMDLLDVTIVNVALPAIRSDLDASPAHLEWILSGYTLALAVLLITGGRLGDIFGRQRVFLLGVAGFTAASLAACLSQTGDALVIARIVQGTFAALMVPQLLSTVQVLYPPKERAAVFGIIGAVSGTAAVIGPVLGGWLVSSDAFGIGWRSIFLINIPVGIVLMVLAITYVPNTRSERATHLDLPGVVLATVGLFLLVFPLIEGRDQGWPAWIWAMFAAAVVVLAAFVVNQRRTEARTRSSLLPMHLFGNRGFSAGLITQASVQGSMAGFALALVIYLQSGLGFSAIHAGLVLLPFSLGAFIGVGISAPLGMKLGKVIPASGAFLQAAGVGWLAVVVSARGNELGGWDATPPMLLTGIGLGLLVVPLVDIALSTVPSADAGAASGTYSTFQQLGAALGIAVIGVIFFNAVGDTFTPEALRHGFVVAAWSAVVGYLVCTASTYFLPAREAVQRHAREQAELAGQV
ncbi:MFS transporter [Aeromicrobium panaciterrae]|uniref:MFS transporter n=1 Tax=Aeromicrobium panaciterrae TaxID=363861 RepID=UPI0031DA8A1B